VLITLVNFRRARPPISGQFSTRSNTQQQIANHAWYTFWYVLPTLPMFLAFPALLPRLGFWLTLFACVIITVVCFGLFALLVRRFGIELL
jgi:ABC-type bacteriocin/lantibiotic exporter with double-glycine peptidase domain